MKISREDVLHVAELAHLELTEAEVETYQRQLDAILTYIEKLDELDTSQVEPLAQVLASGTSPESEAESRRVAGGTEAQTALREDVPAACDVAGEALSGAPDPSPPYFRVPKVIER